MSRCAFQISATLLAVALGACAPAPEGSAPPESVADPPTGKASAVEREVLEAFGYVSNVNQSRWVGVVEGLSAEDPAARFVEASAYFLGTEYENGPLGEGNSPGVVDSDPRVDFDRVDCVTYLEQSLALSLASSERGESLLQMLDAIRYDGGRVDFVSRNHYMVKDWIPANSWLLTDVTAGVAPDDLETVTRRIDRAKFLRDNGVDAAPPDASEITLGYVPSEAVARVDAEIHAGDLVFWIGSVESIFVLHTGMAVRAPDGELLFRHGSSKAGKVLDESFADYAARQSFLGFVVLRLRENPTPPGLG